MLEVRGLQKHYGATKALRGVDLDVHEGEIFGFLGANGAGKTTFTKCLTGIIQPTQGSIRIDGIDALANRTGSLQKIGIVPDEYQLYEHLTARQNVDYYASLYGLKGEEKQQRVQEVLEISGMADKADKKAKAFSHGMKQRTCIAQAILHNPRLIILDEPTNGLDPRGAFELRQLMKALAATGTTVFLNSHVMSEVEQVCDRIAVVRDGRIVATGTPQEIMALSGQLATRIRILNPSKEITRAAEQITSVEAIGTNQLQISCPPEEVGAVVAAIAKAGGLVHGVETVGSTLEEAFLQITGSQ
jgi:ABC-2 type transport system ATP-binding protein